MAGRVRGVAVSTASVVLANQVLDRVGLIFSVGDSTNAGSVILKDVEDATATNGMPLTFGQTLEIVGQAARHRWSAIRLGGVDVVVGVFEEFPDEMRKEPDKGVPS